MKMQLTMAIALMTLASTSSMADDTHVLIGADKDCHLLMTEKECVDHTTKLARLPPGGERDAYLLAHDQLLREREKACPCNRNIDSESRVAEVRYRPGRQAMLRF